MSEKYLIFGATGSIGSSLAEQLVNSGNSVHLVGRDENEVKNISERLGCPFTIADVLEEGFIERVKTDISDVKGVAYRVGSIDLTCENGNHARFCKMYEIITIYCGLRY